MQYWTEPGGGQGPRGGAFLAERREPEALRFPSINTSIINLPWSGLVLLDWRSEILCGARREQQGGAPNLFPVC